MYSSFRDRSPPRFFMSSAWLGAVVVCSLSFVPPGVQAAELVVRDLQAVALVRPTAFDFELNTPVLSRSGNDSFNAGTALELGGRYSFSRVGDPFGIVIGLDVTTESYSYNAQDFMFTYGLRGSFGLGYAINDEWSLTGDAGLLYGRTNLSLPASNAAPAFSSDGDHRGYDVRMTCMYAATRQLLFSIQAGYLLMSHNLTTDQGDQLTIDQRGLYAGIGVIWRFSNAPVHVE